MTSSTAIVQVLAAPEYRAGAGHPVDGVPRQHADRGPIVGWVANSRRAPHRPRRSVRRCFAAAAYGARALGVAIRRPTDGARPGPLVADDPSVALADGPLTRGGRGPSCLLTGREKLWPGMDRSPLTPGGYPYPEHMLFRTKTAMVSEAEALPGRTDQTMPVPDDPLRQRPPPAGPVARGLPDGRVRPRLLLGRREAVLGDRPACGRPPSATPAGTRRTRPTRRCAPAAPATPRSCSSCSTPPSSRYEQLLKAFWEDHDPTPGHAPGQRRRHAVPQRDLHHRRRRSGRPPRPPRRRYSEALGAAGYGEITTEIAPLGDFYYAEPYHQQYLAKNPNGYCPLHATGVSCRV